MNIRSLTFTCCTLLISSAALAHDYRAGDIHIDHPYARASVAGQTSGAAYLTLENKGRQNDSLIAAQSPAAQSVEIHTMSMTADHVMRMREVGSIELKAQEKIVMQPGDGYHIMLLGLKAPLKAGDKLPLTLTFKKAGKVETSVSVEDSKAKAPETKQHQH
jgi:copper(I)-binding protein